MIAARGASLSLIPFLIGSAVVHGTALVVLPGPAAEAPHLDIAASRPLRTTVTLPEPPPETPEAVLEPQPAATPVQRRRTNELPPPPPTPRRTESTPTGVYDEQFEAMFVQSWDRRRPELLAEP